MLTDITFDHITELVDDACERGEPYRANNYRRIRLLMRNRTSITLMEILGLKGVTNQDKWWIIECLDQIHNVIPESIEQGFYDCESDASGLIYLKRHLPKALAAEAKPKAARGQVWRIGKVSYLLTNWHGSLLLSGSNRFMDGDLDWAEIRTRGELVTTISDSHLAHVTG